MNTQCTAMHSINFAVITTFTPHLKGIPALYLHIHNFKYYYVKISIRTACIRICGNTYIILCILYYVHMYIK